MAAIGDRRVLLIDKPEAAQSQIRLGQATVPRTDAAWPALAAANKRIGNILKKADPPYGGEVDYGDRAEHCWNGDHTRPNAISRLRYHQMYVDLVLKRIAATAPASADHRR